MFFFFNIPTVVILLQATNILGHNEQLLTRCSKDCNLLITTVNGFPTKIDILLQTMDCTFPPSGQKKLNFEGPKSGTAIKSGHVNVYKNCIRDFALFECHRAQTPIVNMKYRHIRFLAHNQPGTRARVVMFRHPIAISIEQV